MTSTAIETNSVLFGEETTEGIVAVEAVNENTMRLFLRHGSALETRDEPFTPFLLMEDAAALDGFREPYRVEPLSGANALRFLVLFTRWSDCEKARDHLRRRTGELPSAPPASYLFLSDPVHQHLLLTGKTFFKGMAFSDLHRLALDIETTCTPGYEFPNPAREQDRIISVALMDNRGVSEVLFGTEMDERTMIETVTRRLTELDPDVIEGHNLFNFDLEYLVARARRYGLRLPWGRDGSEPRIRKSRFTVAERLIDYTRMDLFGRHVVDTYFLVQYYDITARELESYGLKSVARHFGLAADDRTYIDPERIGWAYEHDPEALRRYNLDDVRETLALSELLGYPFFLQTRIFPFAYQNIFIRGNATKINALFLREYLRRRASVPKPAAGRRAFEGGYTDVFMQGVIRNVIHCDVASLYPSLMLTYGLQPAGDSLGIFLPLLRDLRSFRLEAKRRAQEADSAHDREYYGALQQTFKILINSFYGYLGTDIHHFADPALAADVTKHGRDTLRRMIDWLRERGATPIEIDTDGIYFVPPPGEESEEAARALVGELSASLPEGIDVEMDGRFDAMFSYKRKNYALLNGEGKVILKGSGLRSRGMEKYLRDFLSAMIRLLLHGKPKEVETLARETLRRLEHHELDISLLAKTETLTESPESYRQKVQARKRNRAATYELALASEKEYRAGDQVSYYVAGEGTKVRVFESSRLASAYDPAHPDENSEYYVAKLWDLIKKFKEFLPAGAPAKKKK